MQDTFFTSALSPLRIRAKIEYLISAAHAQWGKKKPNKIKTVKTYKNENLVCKSANV